MLLYNPEYARNRDCLNAYLHVRLTHSLEDFKEYRGEKFFLLTISDIWSATNGDTRYDINWEPLFSNEILQELKKEKYPILFDSSGEYCTKSNFNTLDSFCKHVDANPNDVYVCLNNTQSVQLTSNINKYNFFSFDRYAFDAVQVSYSMSKILYNFSFNDRKRFLFLNRRYSIERAYMYFKFHKFNLLDSMHSTFRLDYIYNDSPITLQTVIEDMKLTYDIYSEEVIDYIKINSNLIEESLPHTIKTNKDICDLNYKTTHLYSFWNFATHSSTDISIITETFKPEFISEYIFFITEKTYRTIMMKQPFILFSSPYVLKHLRSMGYKTFSPFIDESYDVIENLVERQNAIINEVQRLNNMGKEEFDDLLDKCREITEYNYNILMTRATDKFYNTIWLGSSEKFKLFLRGINKNSDNYSLIKRYNSY